MYRRQRAYALIALLLACGALIFVRHRSPAICRRDPLAPELTVAREECRRVLVASSKFIEEDFRSGDRQLLSRHQRRNSESSAACAYPTPYPRTRHETQHQKKECGKHGVDDENKPVGPGVLFGLAESDGKNGATEGYDFTNIPPAIAVVVGQRSGTI